MTQEWDLPPVTDQVSLTMGEFTLVDWVLTPGSSLISSLSDVAEAMVWHETRMDVWKQLSSFQNELKGTKDVTTLKNIGQYLVKPLTMSEEDARMLLAHVPTTFRWDGQTDVGYSLKLKLATYLRGEKYEIPLPPEVQPPVLSDD